MKNIHDIFKTEKSSEIAEWILSASESEDALHYYQERMLTLYSKSKEIIQYDGFEEYKTEIQTIYHYYYRRVRDIFGITLEQFVPESCVTQFFENTNIDDHGSKLFAVAYEAITNKSASTEDIIQIETLQQDLLKKELDIIFKTVDGEDTIADESVRLAMLPKNDPPNTIENEKITTPLESNIAPREQYAKLERPYKHYTWQPYAIKFVIVFVAIFLVICLFFPRRISPPTNFALQNDTLTWRKNKYADAYTVTITDIDNSEKKVYTVTKNKLDLDCLPKDGLYEIYVIANAKNSRHRNSKKSSSVTVSQYSYRRRDVVYYAPTGTKLHTYQNCSSFRGNVYSGTLSQVKETGRTEWCRKCSPGIKSDRDYQDSRWICEYKIIS